MISTDKTPRLNLARLLPLAIIAVGILAYANSFSNPFIFDDSQLFVARPADAAFWSFVLCPRILVNISYELNRAAGHLNAADYRLVNVLIHVCAGLALFGIIRRTLSRSPLDAKIRSSAPLLAAACSIIWAAHPLQTESVAYISQRCESMMGLFALLSLYCFARMGDSSRKRLWLSLSLLACALGMGTKEGMVVAPFVVLLYDRFFFFDSFRALLRERWRFHAAMFATIGILVALRLNFTGFVSASGEIGLKAAPVSPLVYLGTQFGAITHYLRLSFFPHPLCLDYAWPVATRWPEIVAPGIVVCLLLAWTARASVKGRPAGFLGAFFFLTLAPASSVVPIADMAAEHRMYLPLASVVCAAVLGYYYLVNIRWEMAASTRRAANVLSFAVALAASLFLTIERNRDYASEERMFRAIVEQRPWNFRARVTLASTLLSSGKVSDAKEVCEDFLRKLSEASADKSPKYRALAASNVDYYLPEAHNLLGRVFLAQNRAAEAMEQFNAAIKLRSDCEAYYNNLAVTLASVGRLGEAIEMCGAALAVNPRYVRGYELRAGFLAAGGLYRGAVADYGKALALEPERRSAQCELAWLLATCPDAEVRNGAEATKLATAVCEATGYRSFRGLDALAAARAEQGEFEDAARIAEEAVKILGRDERQVANAAGEAIPTGKSDGSQADLAKAISRRVELYRNRLPFRDGPKPVNLENRDKKEDKDAARGASIENGSEM